MSVLNIILTFIIFLLILINFKKHKIDQNIINKNLAQVPSHKVIEMYIKNNKQDYRFETSLNPVKDLQNRKEDNTTVGR